MWRITVQLARWHSGRNYVALCLAVWCLSVNTSVSAAGEDEIWGDLTMRFVFDGEPPRPRKFIRNGGLPPIPDESLLIDPKTHGIANVLVWLDTDSGQRFPRVHPDYDKQATTNVVQTIDKDAFVPRVAIVRTHQPYECRNVDPHDHHIKCEFYRNASFNHSIKRAESFKATFAQAEPGPAELESTVTHWLEGSLVVVDNPYAAVSDRDGVLTRPKLPLGEWTLIAWHERTGFIKQATVGRKPVEWKRGRLTLKIGPGDNDLGDVLLAPDIFKR